MNRQPWTNKEDQAIQKLIKTYGIQDWTKVANKLKDEGWIPQRTGKQCRQRWYNHLNPSVNKNPWSPYEEKRLFKLHRQYGNRWKEIAQNFIGRTDNDIKNHFYSTLRRSLRRLNKILGQKNSTSQMREIKPSVLSTIMNEIYERDKGIETVNKSFLSTLKDLPFLIFEFTNLKPIKGNIKETKIQEVKEKISNIFELINKFNAQYQNSKIRKRGKDNKIKEIENSTGSSEYKIQNQSEVSLQTKKKVGIYQNQMIEQPDIQKEQQSHLKAIFGGQKIEEIMKPQQSTLLKEQQLSILDEEQQNLQKHKISLDEDYELYHFDDLSQPSLIGYSQDNPFDNLIIVGKHLQVPKITCSFAEEFVEEVLEMNYDNQ